MKEKRGLTPAEQSQAIKELEKSATYFKADLATVIARHGNNRIKAVGVYARGVYAAPLARLLKQLSLDIDAGKYDRPKRERQAGGAA